MLVALTGNVYTGAHRNTRFYTVLKIYELLRRHSDIIVHFAIKASHFKNVWYIMFEIYLRYFKLQP